MTEDPTPLLTLSSEDRQWYDQFFLGLSKKLTALLRRSNDEQIRLLQRNPVQGDIVLIKIPTDIMQKNLRTLSPSTLWALAHRMQKKRFLLAQSLALIAFVETCLHNWVQRAQRAPDTRWNSSPSRPAQVTPSRSLVLSLKVNQRILNISTKHHMPGLVLSVMAHRFTMPRASCGVG